MKKTLQIKKKLFHLMKLSLIQCCLAMIFVGVSLAKDADAQGILNKKISIHIEKQDFESVLSNLEKQADVKFTYRPKLFAKSQKISLNASNETLAEVLNKLFTPLNIQYKIINNQVILSKQMAFNEPNEINSTIQKQIQTEESVNLNFTIKGKITDEKGEALIGASVSLKGSQKGTLTDSEGKYKLEITDAEKNGILVISFIGYVNQEIPLNGKSEINALLLPSAQDLSEIVVVGYGTQKKSDVTSAIVSVDVKDIGNRPLVSAGEAIMGKAAGVQVSLPSGAPGADLTIRVRGIGSPNGGEPLYVVDGVITNSISAIDPGNIASINILKDASAAGIYGAAGSTNGVVIITTKKGGAGKPVTELRLYGGSQSVTKKLDMLNNSQYLTLQQEIGGVALDVPKYYDVTGTNNNWQDLIYRNAPQQGINLSTSGGTEHGSYYLGIGYLNQQGVILQSDFKRYSANFNIDQKITKYLKVGANINYNRTNRRATTDNASQNFGGVVTSALSMPEYIPVKFDANSPNPGYYGRSSFMSGENALANIYTNNNLTLGNNVLGTTYAEITLPADIKFKSQFNAVVNNSKTDYFKDPFASLSAVATGGEASNSTFESLRTQWDNTISKAFVVGSHVTDVIVGASSLNEKISNSFQSGQGFGSNVVKTLNAASTNFRVSTGRFEWANQSYFGRVNYAFKNKYLATATFRRDGSSRVGSNNRWGNFPAFSIGWKLSNENFMKDLTFIQNLRIRAGWGKTGNLPPYTLLYPSSSALNPGGKYPFNGGTATPGINPGTLVGNPDLVWESGIQSNIGLDASFLKDRLSLTVDFYHKKVVDLIFTQQLPLTSGGTVQAVNLPGNNINKGVEIAVNGQIIKSSNFNWSSNFNISFNKNLMTGLNDDISFQSGGVTVGGSLAQVYTQTIRNNMSLGTFWGYKSNGVNPETGNLVYGDKPEVIGNALPKFTYGFSNEFSYKNLSLSALIDGSYGNDVYNALRMEIESMSGFQNQSTAVLSRWQKPGDITDIPRAAGNRSTNSKEAALLVNQASSHFIEDGSFIRLRNVTLAYDLKASLLKKADIQGVKVFVTAQNLLTISKYSGYNPDVNAFGQGTNNQAGNAGSGISLLALGIDRGTYPAAKTFTVGLNFQF